ncbi:uncharacterized protein MONOS_5633 [Monocercomonoides exilis]|uniref:uncharacterized protein n=1 Tax=Monocercomonoides exilis TaxID=2049356 RepID=UPI00355A0A00|nr:hypothetical protein MONOS_5633 [Monocercomonoides exilis]|eukprot:MONOS_5633.1-p1 / transcript=MONOS_5633.1 / gene=MONOS_5633 / organism=Monocercomonoides_exilis_PA203 / gene_product=LOC100101331 protein / transcript_product=LOC100101331 protein / location=Mono_scaffold00166:47244-52225(-) / protein_length=1070 / sequence_SO=supercontig / SO=protein_coding / is_pseudo=false
MSAWSVRQRDYELERKLYALNFSETEAQHPLLQVPETASPQKSKASKSASSQVLDYDPLSGDSGLGDDPLTFGMKTVTTYEQEDEEDDPIIFFTPSHMIRYAEKDMPARFTIRLEKLNNSDAKEIEEVHELSFQGVIELADQRKSELAEAWKNDEKVKALKIVIQLCKFLTDVTYPYLYPRLFAIVCQGLDMFGEKVFERLSVMAFKVPQPGKFSPAEVDAKTKETALNWLYKVSSIRELIPRIFVEAALLRVFSFLLDDPYTATLERLLQQTNGIGHPLVSAYARSYIAKKGLETDRTIRETSDVSLIFSSSALSSSSIASSSASSSSSTSYSVRSGRGRTMEEKEKEKVIFKNNFDDFLFQLNNAKSQKRKDEMKQLGIDFSKYLRVYSPCMQMLITSLARSNKHDDLCATLLRLHSTACPDSLLLFHLIELSPAPRIVFHIDTILERIRKDPAVAQFLGSVKKKSSSSSSAAAASAEVIPSAYNLARLLSELGRRLCEAAPDESDRLVLLNTVWKMATKITNVQEYLLVTRTWIKYPILYCTDQQTDIFLKDIARHIQGTPEFTQKSAAEKEMEEVDNATKKDEQAEDSKEGEGAKEKAKKEAERREERRRERASQSLSSPPPAMQLLCETLCAAATAHPSTGTLIANTTFQQLSNLLSEDESRELGMVIISAVARPSVPPITDSVTVYYLFEMAKKAFLWVDSFTAEDELNRMDKMLVQFATKVDLGRDIEQQLTFYVDLRRVFPKYELLKTKIVLFVNGLAMKTCRFVNFHHTKRTLSFVKGCVAFSHVTCPSVADVGDRIRLLIDSACVAFANNLIGQAEVLLRLMITQILEMPATKTIRSETVDTEPELVELVSEMMSLLVIAPGHPTFGAFVLIRALIKVINDYSWRPDTGSRGILFSRMVWLLATLGQKRLPFKAKDVDSNDALYAQMPEYMEELVGLMVETVNQAYDDVRRLRESTTTEGKKALAMVCMYLSETLMLAPVVNLPGATMVTKCLDQASKAIHETEKSAAISILARAGGNQQHWINFEKRLRYLVEKDGNIIIKKLWGHIYDLQNPQKVVKQ